MSTYTYTINPTNPNFSTFFSTLPTSIFTSLIKHTTYYNNYPGYKEEREYEREEVEEIINYIYNNITNLIIYSGETGEVYDEISFTPDLHSKNYLEILEKYMKMDAEILKQYNTTGEIEIWARLSNPFPILPPPTSGASFEAPDSSDDSSAYDFIGDEQVYYDGPFSSKNCTTYKMDGIRVHKPPMNNSLWAGTAYHCSAEFVDRGTGLVTDKFFGNCNDFADYFYPRAALGRKFDVVLHPIYDDEEVKATMVATKFGTLEQADDGTWAPMEYEPILEVCGMKMLKNHRYSKYLETTYGSDHVKMVEQRSIENNALLF